MGICFSPSFFAVTLRLHEKGNSHLSWVAVPFFSTALLELTLTFVTSIKSASQKFGKLLAMAAMQTENSLFKGLHMACHIPSC